MHRGKEKIQKGKKEQKITGKKLVLSSMPFKVFVIKEKGVLKLIVISNYK